MRVPKLSDEEVQREVSQLSGWTVEGGKLHREYKFAGFGEALAFMVLAGIGIEKMNHHPEWRNVYNRISVDLVTHDVQGISSRDFELARLLDETARKFQ